jgi:hypothetical protein
MALAKLTRTAPSSEERNVDARLADALERLLGTVDTLPPNDHAGEARGQGRLAYHGQIPSRPAVLSFLELLSPRLRHSQRLPYRIPRLMLGWLAYVCVVAGVAVMLVRFLFPL